MLECPPPVLPCPPPPLPPTLLALSPRPLIPPLTRYDDLKTAQENIDLQSTILSRFDLIFIVKDTREHDMQVGGRG